jgi:hypothetical protein
MSCELLDCSHTADIRLISVIGFENCDAPSNFLDLFCCIIADFQHGFSSLRSSISKRDISGTFINLSGGKSANVSKVAEGLKSVFPDRSIIFRAITLSEPPKADLIPYLEAERLGGQLPTAPPRVSLVQFYLDSSAHFQELKYNLDSGQIFDKKDLSGTQSYTDTEEMQASEAACLADPRVQEEIKSLDLPEDAVVCVEPWTYGTDGMNDMSKRIIMVWSCFHSYYSLESCQFSNPCVFNCGGSLLKGDTAFNPDLKDTFPVLAIHNVIESIAQFFMVSAESDLNLIPSSAIFTCVLAHMGTQTITPILSTSVSKLTEIAKSSKYFVFL